MQAEAQSIDESDQIRELDSELEDDLCNLWDMTVKKEVCTVLIEYNCIEILEKYIYFAYGKYPRATELSIGISEYFHVTINMLGIYKNQIFQVTNLCLGNEFLVQKLFTEHQDFIEFFLTQIMLDLNDIETLIQLLRLLNVFAAQNGLLLVESMMKAQGFIQQFVNAASFILSQSLNDQMHETLSDLIACLFDIDADLIAHFSMDSHFLQSLLSSADFRLDFLKTQSCTATTNDVNTPVIHKPYNRSTSNIDVKVFDKLFSNYFAIIQSLTTSESGVSLLCDSFEKLFRLIKFYTDEVALNSNEWEMANIRDLSCDSLKNINCLISILNCLMNNLSPSFVDNLLGDDKSVDSLFSSIQMYMKFFESKQKDLDSDLFANFYDLFLTHVNEFVGLFSQKTKKLAYFTKFADDFERFKKLKL